MRCLPHLGQGSIRAAIGDVIGDGGVEQHGILGDNGDRAPQTMLGDGIDGLTVNADFPFLGVIETEQQP